MLRTLIEVLWKKQEIFFGKEEFLSAVNVAERRPGMPVAGNESYLFGNEWIFSWDRKTLVFIERVTKF